jgi:mRNA interferase HicA
MPLTPKEMIHLLEKNGFAYIPSNNGSHRKYYNKKTGTTVIVPYHVKELKKGLEQKLLKQAGLKNPRRR